MKAQKLYSYVRRAVDDYSMIQDGDKIAVGISGGKDSLTLLYALSGLQRFYPNKFELVALTVDLGFGIQDFSKISEFCSKLNVEYHVIPTEIADIVFNTRKESNPCSLCAKMRKGALNQEARALGCNVIAYAHHRDDVIETLLMSLFYEGRYHCFSPITQLDRAALTIIRPMIYVTEANVIGFKNRFQLPVCKNPCPVEKPFLNNLLRSICVQVVVPIASKSIS